MKGKKCERQPSRTLAMPYNHQERKMMVTWRSAKDNHKMNWWLPRSPSTRRPLPRRKIFWDWKEDRCKTKKRGCGRINTLRSRCMILRMCMWCSPRPIWTNQWSIFVSRKGTFLARFICSDRSPPSQYCMMIHIEDIVLSKKASSKCTILGWRSFSIKATWINIFWDAALRAFQLLLFKN